MTALPEEVRRSPWRSRIEVAAWAVASAGVALLDVRRYRSRGVERGDQLKTSVDRAAEGWVLGWLEGEFPGEAVLAEERHSADGDWTPAPAFWTVDALDGTRSFVDGYPGFCVQVAWIEDGRPRLGVIAEPVAGRLYVAAEGAGAWRLEGDSASRIHACAVAPKPPRFVDSVRPKGIVGTWMDRENAEFVECGSCGLKIARIAEGSADVYAKRFRYRLWDVAPGQVLLAESGGQLGEWDGSALPMDGTRIEWTSMLVSASRGFDACVAELSAG